MDKETFKRELSHILICRNAENVLSGWEHYRSPLMNAMLTCDPSQFLTFRECCNVIHVEDLDITGKAARSLDKRLINGARTSSFGGYRRSGLDPHLSLMANYVRVFEVACQINIQSLATIVEYGGGYGGMAHVISRLGFTGNYFMYDLPEFLLLQRFYLSNVGVSADTRLDETLAKYADCDLMICSYSWAELPVGFTGNFIERTKPKRILLFEPKFHHDRNVMREIVEFFDQIDLYNAAVLDSNLSSRLFYTIATRRCS